MDRDLYTMEYPYKNGIPGHPRMDAGKRAKIFMPFAALKGFQEELALQEYKPSVRSELSEEEAGELDAKLRGIFRVMENQASPPVRILFFKVTGISEFGEEQGDYVELSGKIEKIDPNGQYILLEGARISIRDIREISVTEE